ncbi:hypothetical protein OWV82_026389 [Melia azedarach]|nr:hypothetical protein OWV82_026389 [Melia azedarach]
MAWVGRLRARASNCRRSIRFSYSPSASLALRVRSVSCVAYPCEGIRRFRCSNPPCALPGAGWTRGVLRVPGVPCDTSHGRLGPRSLARALGCGTLCVGARPTRPCCAQAPCIRP